MGATARDAILASERRRLSVDEYHRLASAGILAADERVELIAGDLVTIAPIGPRHMTCVNLLVDLLTKSVAGRTVVSPQNALMLGENSEFYPDVALLSGPARRYTDRVPQPDDVRLVIEVAETTIRRDREAKVPLYAAAGIPEVWVVNLEDNRVEVFRQPGESGYGSVRQIGSQESLSLLAFPDVRLVVSDLLP